jgi:hypothetical protein
LMHFPPTHSSPAMAFNPAHSVPSGSELNDAAIKTMAATNPSRPLVSVPTAIGELKDIPGTVRSWGRRLFAFRISRSFVARMLDLVDIPVGALPMAYLTREWVIKPAVSDITKLLQFHEGVSQRLSMLKRLQTEGSIKGRGSVSNSTLTSTTTGLVIESMACWIECTRLVIDTRKVWGSCTWRKPKDPHAPNLPSSDRELLALSKRLVSGVTTFEALQTAWELLPWSWLIDWFSSIGTVIAAANNTVNATPGDFCVMCTRIARNAYSVTYKDDWVNYKPGWEEYSHKWRVPTAIVGPFSSAHFPLIDGRKFSILTSLEALRRRSRVGLQ